MKHIPYSSILFIDESNLKCMKETIIAIDQKVTVDLSSRGNYILFMNANVLSQNHMLKLINWRNNQCHRMSTYYTFSVA